jgi:Cu/Ag efflux protein CusF
MRKMTTLLFTVLALLATPLSFAAEHGEKDAPGGAVGRTVEMQATVTAIDVATRMVTLKGDDGIETTMQVDNRARNLAQVKVGDVVKVAYVQALAWQLSKSTKMEPTVEVEEAAGRTEPGQKPGGAAGRRITMTAQIEAIDTAAGTVTLKGPGGKSRTIKAKNPENLKKVKVGDLIDISYTEAVAIKVEPAAK